MSFEKKPLLITAHQANNTITVAQFDTPERQLCRGILKKTLQKIIQIDHKMLSLVILYCSSFFVKDEF